MTEDEFKVFDSYRAAFNRNEVPIVLIGPGNYGVIETSAELEKLCRPYLDQVFSYKMCTVNYPSFLSTRHMNVPEWKEWRKAEEADADYITLPDTEGGSHD